MFQYSRVSHTLPTRAKMKLLVIVALFAFVAVKVSQAAPAPGDDKKDEVPTSPVAVPDVTPPVAAPAEMKSEAPASVSSAVEKVDAPAPTV